VSAERSGRASAGGDLIGIDLGGTAIKAGRIRADGSNPEPKRSVADVHDGPEAVCERIVELAHALGFDGSLGIGVPGLVDRQRGLVTHSPNLAPMQGFPVRDHLAAKLGVLPEAIRMENDANVAALGEFWIGAARGHANVLLATLGTGIGGGLILNGELFLGGTGLAAEVGHLTVRPDGPRCGCGNLGCLEALASATAAERRAREAGLTDDLAALSGEARTADGPARELLREIGRDLGRGLAPALMLLDLDCFLIGGGFSAAFDLLRPGILDGLLERSYGRRREDLNVRAAELGGDAGWIGAARLGAI